MSVSEVGQIKLEELQEIVGPEHARPAGELDVIDEVGARYVAAPGSVAEASHLLRLAHQAGLAVAPRGAGSMLSLGNQPERVDLILETHRLNRVVEYVPADLVVKVEAGVKLDELRELLGASGQMLALNPPERAATVGGLIATNASGSWRLRYGTIRDLLIGLTFVLADGTVAKSGGKVVKNVAGYDLGKLFTGSLGTLGLIVEAVFRLHPLPAARRSVVLELGDPDAMGSAVQRVLHSPLVPTALELSWDGTAGSMVALFDGIKQGVKAQAEQLVELWEPEGRVRLLKSEAAAKTWRQLNRLPWQRGGIGMKVNVVPVEVPRVLRDMRDVTASRGVDTRVVGRAGNGVLLVGLVGGTQQDWIAIIRILRERVGGPGGSVVLVQGPVALKRAVDVWGPVGDALPVMRAVKERFDPQHVMNPGRFVGGI